MSRLSNAAEKFRQADLNGVKLFIEAGEEVWKDWQQTKDEFQRKQLLIDAVQECVRVRARFDEEGIKNAVKMAFLAKEIPLLKSLSNRAFLTAFYRMVSMSMTNGSLTLAFPPEKKGKLAEIIGDIVNARQNEYGDFRITGGKREANSTRQTIVKALRQFMGNDEPTHTTKQTSPSTPLKTVAKLTKENRFKFLQLVWRNLDKTEKRMWRDFIVRGEDERKAKKRKQETPVTSDGAADDTKLENEPAIAPQETINV